MPEQAEKAKKSQEKKAQVEQAPLNEAGASEFLQEQAGTLLALQQAAGNRAVNQFIQKKRRSTSPREQRQMANSGILTPGNASSGVVQLFRSGRVEPSIQFEEGPEDEVNIQLPYQIETFDEVLAIIDRVIQTFGSGRRSYTQDDSFRTSLTAYLQEHQHPSMGGSPMNRERNLVVRVRLIRGDGNHIERIEHIRLGHIEYVAAQPERGTEGANQVAVNIPYETGSLEEMLDIIEGQIQAFDPQCLEHVQNEEFQTQLRDYLISIDHPVVSESATANAGAALNLQVRLVYGPRGSVDSLQLLAPSTRRPEGAEAPPEPVRRSQWGSFWIRVAAAAEQHGRDVSGRALFETLNRHMQNFSDEFVRVNESRNLHAEEQFITPFIAMSHLVLQMALSLVDLVAQANPENFMMIGANRMARGLAGEYGLEEFQQDIRSALELGWNLTPISQFIAGWREMSEGEEGHNDYQIFHGLEVMVVSIGATYELAQSARGAYQSRQAARTGATTIPEGEGVLRGQEAGQIPIIEEPAEALPARAEPARIATPAEAPRQPAAETPASEAAPAARSAEPPAARPAETPAAEGTPAAPREPVASEPPFAGQPPSLENGVVMQNVAHSRRVLAMYQERGGMVYGLDSAHFERAWREAGGVGDTPSGFMNGNFDLVLNRDLIPEAPGFEELARRPRPAAQQAGAPRRSGTPEEETGSGPVEYAFVRDLEMARARELLDAWRRDQLPAEYRRVVIPLNQEYYIADYRAYSGPSEVAPPAWVGERGVLNFDLQNLGLSEAAIDQVRAEYTTRGGSRVLARVGDWTRPPIWRVEVSAFTPEEAQAFYHDMRQAGKRIVEVDTTENMRRVWNDLGQTGDNAPTAFIGSDEVLIVDMEAVQRAGGVPEVEMAGEAGGRAAPAREAVPSAPASGSLRPGGNLPPDVEAAARDFGMRRIYLPEDIDLARQAMQDAIANGDRITPVSARALPGRWRLCVSVGETPLAFIMPDGEFIYNRDVLTRE